MSWIMKHGNHARHKFQNIAKTALVATSRFSMSCFVVRLDVMLRAQSNVGAERAPVEYPI